MSVEDWQVSLVTAAAIAGTLALLLYCSFAKWYLTVVGRARVAAELGWVALLDVALYAHWTHHQIPTWGVLTIYAAIAVGSWLWLGAVVHEQFLRRKR